MPSDQLARTFFLALTLLARQARLRGRARGHRARPQLAEDANDPRTIGARDFRTSLCRRPGAIGARAQIRQSARARRYESFRQGARRAADEHSARSTSSSAIGQALLLKEAFGHRPRDRPTRMPRRPVVLAQIHCARATSTRPRSRRATPAPILETPATRITSDEAEAHSRAWIALLEQDKTDEGREAFHVPRRARPARSAGHRAAAWVARAIFAARAATTGLQHTSSDRGRGLQDVQVLGERGGERMRKGRLMYLPGPSPSWLSISGYTSVRWHERRRFY